MWSTLSLLQTYERLHHQRIIEALGGSATDPFREGSRIARGFADLGYEEFFVLPGQKILSLFTGKVAPFPEEHRQFFFQIFSPDDACNLLLKLGFRITKGPELSDDGRRFELVLAKGGVSASSIEASLDLCLAKALELALGYSQAQSAILPPSPEPASPISASPHFKKIPALFKVTEGEELILASSSPRRKQLLTEIQLPFEVRPSHCPEERLPGEHPSDMVMRLALAKATVLADLSPSAWVIGADTTVFCDGMVLEKPQSPAEACDMLLHLQGREHQVLGGIALICRAKNFQRLEYRSSLVAIRPLSKETIAAYVATGEPLDKAGSYAIQGLGAALVESIQGSYTNVVGLDLAALCDFLLEARVIRCGG